MPPTTTKTVRLSSALSEFVAAGVSETGFGGSSRLPIAATQYLRTAGKRPVAILTLLTIVPGPIALLRPNPRRARGQPGDGSRGAYHAYQAGPCHSGAALRSADC
jgi:hypothetical protein